MPGQKKMLIAGGGYADIPLVQAAKALGFHVITSGNRRDDPGHRYSDECRLADYSDETAMLRLARDLRIDAICAGCNDFSALSSAYVAERMGLPGHDPSETARIIHHKDRYRQFARMHGIPTPHARGFSSIEEALGELHGFRYPLIIKPVDLTGGKGISRIARADQASKALETAFHRSHAKRVVVEEFIEGSRHGLSTFIRDGRVVFYFSDDEHYFLNPYLVSAASTPGTMPAQAVKDLCRTAETIASLLSLENGIFHIQYILGQDGPVIIEICRRAPGDLYIRFVHLATGVDYPAAIVRAASGMDCSDLTRTDPAGYFTRHCMMTSRAGVVRGLVIDPAVQGDIIEQFMWWKAGDRVDDFLTHKFGIVFLRFNSMGEMLRKTDDMQNLIRVDLA